MAESFLASERFDESLHELKTLTALAPANPRLWYIAGLIWLERDPPKAFERAAQLAPDVPGTFYRLGLARE